MDLERIRKKNRFNVGTLTDLKTTRNQFDLYIISHLLTNLEGYFIVYCISTH